MAHARASTCYVSPAPSPLYTFRHTSLSVLQRSSVYSQSYTFLGRKEEEEQQKKKMDLREIGMDSLLADALHELLDLSDETPETKSIHHAPSRAYIRDKKAMAATPADVLEYPDSYVFVLDVPGLKQDQVCILLPFFSPFFFLGSSLYFLIKAKSRSRWRMGTCWS